jgi:hypothetical protein
MAQIDFKELLLKSFVSMHISFDGLVSLGGGGAQYTRKNIKNKTKKIATTKIRLN